jgi:hypothetical protein
MAAVVGSRDQPVNGHAKAGEAAKKGAGAAALPTPT